MADHSDTHKLPFGAARLCQDLATLVNNRQGSDIQFKVGGRTSTLQGNGETIYNESATVTLYAHSIILRCRSQYFATMLGEDKHWKESSDGVIYKPNLSPSTLQDVLHYIYTGDIRVKNSENIIELITAADEMNLNELSTRCQTELISIVENIFSNEDSGDDNNDEIPIDVTLRKHILPALNLAESHSLSYLSQKLQAIILPHISIIVESPDAYTTFINEISFEALYKVISSDYLAMSERGVWDIALNWGCHKIEISKVAVEAQLSNPEDEEDEDESLNETVISTTQLGQLKAKIAPLLPAIRFSLFDADDYREIFDILNYFLPRRRSSEINRFFLKPDNTDIEPLDMPRKESLQSEVSISSKITVNYSTWRMLRKNIFETGCIRRCLSSNHLKFELLFRASEHNFLGKAFHRHCNNKGPTIVLVRSVDGYLFGGVNFNHWESLMTDSSSSNFLFTLSDGNHRTRSAIFRIDPTKVKDSTYSSPSLGPTFGYGCEHGTPVDDLMISSPANTTISRSQLPNCYIGSRASNISLAGSKNFLVSEYEVFAISS